MPPKLNAQPDDFELFEAIASVVRQTTLREN